MTYRSRAIARMLTRAVYACFALAAAWAALALFQVNLEIWARGRTTATEITDR